jgi:hypothetical protein
MIFAAAEPYRRHGGRWATGTQRLAGADHLGGFTLQIAL